MPEETKIKKIEVECPNCGNKWETGSTLKKVSCSGCQHKVENPNYKFKGVKVEP